MNKQFLYGIAAGIFITYITRKVLKPFIPKCGCSETAQESKNAKAAPNNINCEKQMIEAMQTMRFGSAEQLDAWQKDFMKKCTQNGNISLGLENVGKIV